MKRLLFLSFLLSTQAFGFDTYLFRIQIDASTRRKSDVDTIFATKGRGKPADQPFYGTYVLPQNDTNYVLVKITPSDANEETMVKNLFNLPQADFYQQYSLNQDRGLTMIVDNSKQFPVDTDWSIVKTSPTKTDTETTP